MLITNVLFTKDAVEITGPRLAQMVIDIKPDQMRIESNNGGKIFANDVRRLVKENDKLNKCIILGAAPACELPTKIKKTKICSIFGMLTIIQARPTTKKKPTRILMKSGWIDAHYHFLDESEYVKG